jgi:serine/threonine protein kinase
MTSKSLPEKIAKYAIEGILGSGAMGVVYKAYDEQIDRPVAIKVLHEHLRRGGDGDELAARFLQEARAAARCLHPNIVTIFDFGSDGAPYIVMEYVQGVELRSFLKANIDLPFASAVDITVQVLDALGYAHNKGVVHRDIKPDNIILLESGAVKVSDFGVARLDTSDLTGTGFMIGTPSYMSPEGLQGKHVDARSDLFSAGVVLFELVSRQRFNRDISLRQNLDKIKTGESLTSKNLGKIQRILGRALQNAAADRFQSAGEFMEQLQQMDDMDTQATVVFVPQAQQATRILPGQPDSTSAWDSEQLSSLEQSLAVYVGPMAKLLVKKSLRNAQTFDGLIEQLILHIPTEIERSQFKMAVQRSGVTNPYATTGAKPAMGTSGPVKPAQEKKPAAGQEISEAKQLALNEILAFYTGPIAQRLIRKYLPECVDFSQLVNACARHILDVKERQQFLDRTGKI